MSVPGRFVRFVKLEDAEKAMKERNGAMYKNHKLTVEMSSPYRVSSGSNQRDTGEWIGYGHR